MKNESYVTDTHLDCSYDMHYFMCRVFLTLKYSTISKAERKTVPYTLLYTKQNNILYSNSTNNEKKL